MNRFQRCPTCTKVIFKDGFCSIECKEEFKRQIDQVKVPVNFNEFYKGGDKNGRD